MGANVSTLKTTFDPEMVAVINRAFAAALAALDASDAHSVRRTALAKHVMDLAMAGETDETRLRDGAVAQIRREENGSPTYTGL